MSVLQVCSRSYKYKRCDKHTIQVSHELQRPEIKEVQYLTFRVPRWAFQRLPSNNVFFLRQESHTKNCVTDD